MNRYIRIIIQFLFIISTGGIYYQFYSTVINACVIFLSIILFFSTDGNKIYFYKYRIKLLIVSLIITVNYIVNKESVVLLNYLTLYSSIIAITVLIYHYNTVSADIIDDILIILKIILIHSIANFFIVNLYSSNFTLWTDKVIMFQTRSLFKLFFFNTTEIGNLIKRNCGLFWEPGILQIFINLYVFLKLFVKKNMDYKAMIFCLAVMLSTNSTTGIVILFLLTITYYQKAILKKSSIIPIALLAILSFTFLKSNLEDKFQGSQKNSSKARIYDTVIGAFLILEKPLWGFGFKSKETTSAQDKNKNSSIALSVANILYMHERGNTNSIIMNFVYWGIPIGTIVIFLIFKQTLIQEKKFLFSIICLLFCATEPLLFTNFFIMIILSGCFGIDLKTNLIEYENC